MMQFEKVAVVGDRELVLGFKLIGIQDVFIRPAEEALELFPELVNSGKYNLIIMSEALRSMMNGSTLRLADTSLNPLVIFIPLPGKERNQESVEELAKRVLGVDINGLKGA